MWITFSENETFGTVGIAYVKDHIYWGAIRRISPQVRWGQNANKQGFYPRRKRVLDIWRVFTGTPCIWGWRQRFLVYKTDGFSTTKGSYPQFLVSYPQMGFFQRI